MTLREVLHAHIPTLTRLSTIADAIDKMDIYQFPALVIVDEDIAPIAVVTEGDICRAVTQQDSLSRLRDEPALQVATMDPTVMSADTEVSEALHQMLSQGITILQIGRASCRERV